MTAEQIDQMDRIPPCDLDAERYVLASILDQPAALEQITEILMPGDFYRPGHGELYRLMILLWAQRLPVDPVTLKDALIKDPDAMLSLGGKVDYILTLYGLRVAGFNGVAHARIVWDRACRRRIIETGTRMIQLGYAADGDIGETVARAQKDLDGVSTEIAVDEHGKLQTLDQFMKLKTPRSEPVIDGLLHHEERVIVVGLEGDGKTTLGLQVAFAAAAGVHPFSPADDIKPCKVLWVDFENPRYELERRFEFFSQIASRYNRWDPRNLHIWSKPGGIDLRQARDCYQLADKIRQAQPDLVVGGPIYKMIVDTGEHSEQTHSHVTRFWDGVRERYGFALWLETHAPIAQMRGQRALRPQGSGIYSRWPEFGITLEKAPAKYPRGSRMLGTFRGHRDAKRIWPEMIQPSRMPGINWPWIATYPQGTFTEQPS